MSHLVPNICSLLSKVLLLVLINLNQVLQWVKKSQEPVILDRKLILIEDPSTAVQVQINTKVMLISLATLPTKCHLVINMYSNQTVTQVLVNIDQTNLKLHQKLKVASFTVKLLRKEDQSRKLQDLQTIHILHLILVLLLHIKCHSEINMYSNQTQIHHQANIDQTRLKLYQKANLPSSTLRLLHTEEALTSLLLQDTTTVT